MGAGKRKEASHGFTSHWKSMEDRRRLHLDRHDFRGLEARASHPRIAPGLRRALPSAAAPSLSHQSILSGPAGDHGTTQADVPKAKGKADEV